LSSPPTAVQKVALVQLTLSKVPRHRGPSRRLRAPRPAVSVAVEGLIVEVVADAVQTVVSVQLTPLK